ncbi:MAG: 50S ribosomal protein L9 [Candidatus Omnitrophica bacterium]|nr:50S ribosomal protein L9 [Candidatus Omnitrophota bacterium]MBU1923718.1 50S ribosomal protein L9 [Candidatus Omnitrophota bacterium]
MEVILIKDVEKIGKAGSVVKVKEGFARNFLFPHNLAKVATSINLKQLEKERQIKSAQYAKAKEESGEVKKRLDALSLTISVLAQQEEKLYGSISALDIAVALKEEGFSIDKNAIDLAEPIKSLGIYELAVKLHPEVIATLKLWVVKR